MRSWPWPPTRAGHVTSDIAAVIFDGSAMAAAVAVPNLAAARAKRATTVVAAPPARLLKMIGADDLAGSAFTVVSGERIEPGGDTADPSGHWHADR